VPSASADIVIIGGGSNDAIFRALGTDIFKAVQTMINIAHASGVEPMLTTIPPTCCERAALNTFIDDYNLKLLDLARINNIPIADVHRGFANSCTLSTCHLLNQPEGLHPNIDGYDVMGDVVIAALFGIDIFSSDGASELEQALGLVPGSVKTKPDRAPETTTEEGSS
jgi:lysophospholipase L1-like esterase